MKFIADENVSKSIVNTLRNYGYDLLWIREYCRGMADEEIVCLSSSQNRIIMTFDKDFGELIYRRRMETPGVILVRIPDDRIGKEKILEFLRKHGDELKGYFVVLTEGRIRRRRLLNISPT